MMHLMRILAIASIVQILLLRGPVDAIAARFCSAGLTLTTHPGLPSSSRTSGPPIARDIPRTPVRVSLPLFPGATHLLTPVGNLILSYQDNPYLQTAVTEYTSSQPPSAVTAWYRAAFLGCGWHDGGTMHTNAGPLTDGLGFVAKDNPNLTVEVNFGATPSGGSYIAYAVLAITYPPRPEHSYLHGPFVAVRIALVRSTMGQHGPIPHTVHASLISRPRIADLVRAVNAIRDYRTRLIVCPGPLRLVGPAWLTFVRADGSQVHAFERGPGECGGLVVNGVRWLVDPGVVWNLILSDAPGAAAGK